MAGEENRNEQAFLEITGVRRAVLYANGVSCAENGERQKLRRHQNQRRRMYVDGKLHEEQAYKSILASAKPDTKRPRNRNNLAKKFSRSIIGRAHRCLKEKDIN